MKKIFVLFMSVQLTGCAQLAAVSTAMSNVTITQRSIDTAIAGYDSVFLAPAIAYTKLPLCGTGLCKKQNVVDKLAQVDRAVNAAFAKTQAQLDLCLTTNQNDCAGAAAAFMLLQSAITTAKDTIKVEGVR